MSKGIGSTQRFILDALEVGPLLRLRGETRAESVAMRRAALALEKASRCLVVRLRDGDGSIVLCAARTDYAPGGKPVRELSVAPVPYGTSATLKGSIRQIA